MTIEKTAKGHTIFSKTGRQLGTFGSRKAAEEREREIRFFANRDKKS